MSKKLNETPSQTAGPFLHIGCTPRLININVFKEELGSYPFKNMSLDNTINIKGTDNIIVFFGKKIFLECIFGAKIFE